MKRLGIILLATCIFSTTHAAEKVGLVLSGGAAKGIIHIGVIKALEENSIPIDYIAGTSMGAIVGSLYAMGLTTDEMIDIIKSDDFATWLSGEIPLTDQYYFRKQENKPDMLSVSFRIEDGDSLRIKPNILPINLVNPRQMNYAFLELYGQKTAACQGDFDKLMIPFRSVAADIYKKEAVVLRKGDLGDAVRTSMTFPFMFRPILVDGRLLFDGGIYNNFPVDVMKDDFAPDYIIGSNVGDDSAKRPDPDNIIEQITTMISNMIPQSEKSDLLLAFDFDANVNIWDFTATDALVQRGYDSTMVKMAEIKQRLSRRVSPQQMAERRSTFKAKEPEFNFAEVEFEGITPQQEKYIRQYFPKKDEEFGLKEFRQAYYKLLSENIISEISPHAHYDSQKKHYILHLNVKTEDQLSLSVGGNLSLTTPNQLYVGINFKNLTNFGQTAWVDFHVGRVFNGVNLGLRLDFLENMYLKPQFNIHRFDYYTGDYLFYENEMVHYFKNDEMYTKMDFGFSITMRSKAEIGIGYGRLTDQYIQDRQLALEYQEQDKSSYSVLNLHGTLMSDLQNKKSYPTSGRYWSAKLQMLYGNEHYQSTAFPQNNIKEPYSLWLYAKAEYDDYFNFTKYFTLGAHAQVAYSTRKLLNNYTSSIIQAPQFAPTPHSRVVFNEGFCANQFAAVGIKPIYTINDALQLRLEGYGFVPFKTIQRKADNTAYYSDYFDRVRFMSEFTVAYDFKIAVASVYVNYYSTPKNNWNFGLNIGFLLFDKKFME